MKNLTVKMVCKHTSKTAKKSKDDIYFCTIKQSYVFIVKSQDIWQNVQTF